MKRISVGAYLSISLLIVLSFFALSSDLLAQASTTESIQASPDIHKYLLDEASLVKDAIRVEIAKTCSEIESKMKIRVLVKTKRFTKMNEGQAEVESFFSEWIRSIALDKRGILIFAVLPNTSEHGRIYLRVGIGLKYLVTKEMGRKILDQVILPQNALNNDGKAFLEGANAIKKMLLDELKRVGQPVKKGTGEFSLIGFIWNSKEILLALLVAALLCYIIFFVERCPRCNAALIVDFEILKEPGVNTLGVKRKTFVCEKCGFSRRKKEPVYPRGKTGWWMRIAGVRRNVKID